MKRVAAIQSNYIPWKGYFDIIHDTDLFVFYDDVQFTKNDWRNRNKIKTSHGTSWLTIPTGQNLNRLICEVALPDGRWQVKHWKAIQQYYSRAPHFADYKDFFEHVYLERKWANLSEFNQFLTKAIARDFLGITTEFADSRRYDLSGAKFDRLMSLLPKVEASFYVTGESAEEYIDEQRLQSEDIQVVYKSYAGYPEYPQFFPPFDHYVSIIDVLFQVGPQAPEVIWGWRQGTVQGLHE